MEAQLPPGSEFTTTHWTDIQAARTATPERRRAVLEGLACRYWKPVYHYLRAHGYADADALDIAQEFFAEVILRRDLFGQADPTRGRFRPYLLHCLKNFTRELNRHAHAQRRAPDQPIVALQPWGDSSGDMLPASPSDSSPDAAFHRQWAASLLDQAVQQLAAACRTAGLDVHYTIFHERFVRPALEAAPPTPLETLAERFGLTIKQAANRGETVRRRFRTLLLSEVRMTVGDEAEAADELECLLGELRR